MPGSLTLTGLVAGLASGEKVIGPSTMTDVSVVGQITDITLVTGDNTFAVPTGAVAVAVFLPSTNASNITFRTSANSGDSGLPINPSGPWFVIPFAGSPTSVILHATSGGASVELNFI
jgi:hypothetical protein